MKNSRIRLEGVLLPKMTDKQMDALTRHIEKERQDYYGRGIRIGSFDTEERLKKTPSAESRKARIEALRVLTEFYRQVGQASSGLAQAILSEADQL